MKTAISPTFKINSGSRVLLADRILSETLYLPDWKEPGAAPRPHPEMTAEINPRIQNAALVEFSNIAEYFYASAQGGNTPKKWSLSDFSEIMPPFPRMWLEARASPVCKKTMARGFSATGLLFETSLPMELRHVQEYLREELPNTYGEISLGFKGDYEPTKLCFLVQVACFIRFEGDSHAPDRTVLLGVSVYLVSKEGEQMSSLTCLVAGFNHESAPRDKARALMIEATFPALLAINFMHFRNVSTLENAPDARYAKKWKKRRGTEMLTFKTIVLDGAKRTLSEAGAPTQGGLKKALQIVRGNRAVYTAEKPLFGRYVGPVWRPSHARGASDLGSIKKSYVLAPQSEEMLGG